MGNTLTGQIVAETYEALLKVTDNGIITGTKKRITDGFGNDTPLLLSSTDVQIDGNILLSGTTSQYVRGDGSFATFTSGGLTSVGLTLGSAGTDAGISGSPLTSNGSITLNLPSASATNRGLLTSTDWSTFNSKQGALTLTTTGSSGASTLVGTTLNVPTYSLSGLGGVPYTGATADVDLGIYNLTLDALIGATADFTSSGSGNTFEITHSSGSGIALNIEKGGAGEGLYINKTSGSGNAATIIGTLNATTLVKNGGTSSQFLKADGSVDSTTYTPTTRTISTTAPLSGGGDLSADRTLTISQASTSTDGYLSSTNWNTFNGKESALTFSSPLSRTTNTISIPVATTSVNGYLSSTDWNTFNGKQETITGGATTITTSNLTASRALVSDGSGKVAVATTTATEIGYVNGVTSAIQTQLDSKASKTNVFNAQTGTTYTLVLSDAGKIIEMQSGSANTLTIPTNASVAFPIGTEIQVLQFGAGQTTIGLAIGVTNKSKSNQVKIGNQYTGVTLVKRATNDWYIIGNLTA